MSLLIGSVVDADKWLVESKLLEWPRSSDASWRGSRDGLLLECDSLDCYVFAEDDGGDPAVWRGGRALAQGVALKRLGGIFRLMFLIGLDQVLQGRWLPRLVNTSWLGVSSVPKIALTAGALFHQRRQKTCILGSCGNGSLQLFNHLYDPYVMLLVCVPTLYCYVYEYN
jgi:hypothetical protein